MVIACNPDFSCFPLQEANQEIQLKKLKKNILMTTLQGLKELTYCAFPDRYLYSSTQNCVYAIEG